MAEVTEQGKTNERAEVLRTAAKEGKLGRKMKCMRARAAVLENGGTDSEAQTAYRKCMGEAS